MLSAKRSSTRAALLGAIVAGVVVAALALAGDRDALLAIGLGITALGAGLLALHLIASERRRHERIQESLSAQASLLEALVESLGTIAATRDTDEILELTRREAEQLFGARATIVEPGTAPQDAPGQGAVYVPLRVRGENVAALQITRPEPFERWDAVRATVLADFAARAIENARLLDEAQVREAERSRLSDQLITAEQDERRRLALFLHDTAVQSLSGIALMTDAALHSISVGKLDEATTVMTTGLERLRETIRSLRDLSFALEPVVLRDQGFGPAVAALGEQLGLERQIQIDVDVDAGDALSEKAQAALYQIIREALHGAIRRGPPTRISVRVEQKDDGAIETVISDDAPGERRRATFDALAERARTLSGQFDVEGGEEAGTTVRVTLPPYSARR